MFYGVYEFSEISLTGFQANIIQTSSGFNFDDLTPAEDPETDTTASAIQPAFKYKFDVAKPAETEPVSQN